MKNIRSISESDLTVSQALWEAAQIGFWSAVLSVVELGAMISKFVHRGKQQTDLVEYD
ncbi:MAG: hypothetical protein WCI57_02700 [Candidatus Berkelbacteria bacterium]